MKMAVSFPCRPVNRLDGFERQLVLFAPGGKLRDRDEVRLARIPVTDVGGEEFPKAPAAGRYSLDQVERILISHAFILFAPKSDHSSKRALSVIYISIQACLPQ